MEKPSIHYYRRIQVHHYLIYDMRLTSTPGDTFAGDQDIPPEAFATRGCPGCNRPYYTETPRNLYNFPHTPADSDMTVIREQLE
jgi:biotin synthase